MGRKRKSYEKLNDFNISEMKGITKAEIHNTAGQKHDRGYGGIAIITNLKDKSECVIGSTNLPRIIVPL